LQEARNAGIRIVMVTGDHGATAVAIADTLGLDSGRVVNGAELEAMTPDQRRIAATETNIFARVSPGQKLAIVEALKEAGEVVAVTGDGVNDAPALKRADVGIAMGQRGSDVSREVADLVLLDDNFATIVAAVEEGRNIYTNIQKFIRFLFSTNLSEILVVVVGALAAFWLDLRDSAGNLLLPLTAAQLLWINLVTDGAPALALTLDRTPGLMRRPPRPVDTPLLDRPSLQFIGATGTAKAGLALLLLYLLPQKGYSLDLTRSAVFALLACGQLLFVYPARRSVPASLGNWLLHIAVISGFVAQWAVVQIPELAGPFQAVGLPPAVWFAVIATAFLAWAAAELIAALIRGSRLQTFR
jgi:Ca2+-transporting ATPase